MGITKPCTHLHPAPSTSTQLISASTQLSATPSTVLEPKYRTKLGNFPKFRPENSKLFIFTENWHTWHLGSADSEFLPNLGRKSQRYPFCLKIGTHDISRMLILVPTWVFWISNPKSIFGQIWTKKVKVAHFGWKLAYRVSRGCWFLFRH